MRSAPHATRPPAGFTLVEIQVAVLLLGSGIGALLGTAVLDIRMVGRGRQATRAVLAAASRMEWLRARAAAPGHCTGLAAGADSLADGRVVRWSLAASGAARPVVVAVEYPVAGTTRSDSLTSLLVCP
jgi:Tfp pilus assembly protein PilV